jgi:hypothetical protein
MIFHARYVTREWREYGTGGEGKRSGPAYFLNKEKEKETLEKV